MWLRARVLAVARRAVRDQRGITLVSQIAGLVVGVAVLGTVTTVFDAVGGVSRNTESRTVAVQRAQNAIDLITNTLTDAVKGSWSPVIGTAKMVEAQVPEDGGGLRVVRFCLQTGGENGGVLYQQMVYEATIDSSPNIFEGFFAGCPDPEWTYNGEPSAIVIADRITNYEESPTHRIFTYRSAPSGGRQSLAIDLFVKPPDALQATELTGSVTPRLQLGPQ